MIQTSAMRKSVTRSSRSSQEILVDPILVAQSVASTTPVTTRKTGPKKRSAPDSIVATPAVRKTLKKVEKAAPVAPQFDPFNDEVQIENDIVTSDGQASIAPGWNHDELIQTIEMSGLEDSDVAYMIELVDVTDTMGSDDLKASVRDLFHAKAIDTVLRVLPTMINQKINLAPRQRALSTPAYVSHHPPTHPVATKRAQPGARADMMWALDRAMQTPDSGLRVLMVLRAPETFARSAPATMDEVKDSVIDYVSSVSPGRFLFEEFLWFLSTRNPLHGSKRAASVWPSPTNLLCLTAQTSITVAELADACRTEMLAHINNVISTDDIVAAFANMAVQLSMIELSELANAAMETVAALCQLRIEAHFDVTPKMAIHFIRSALLLGHRIQDLQLSFDAVIAKAPLRELEAMATDAQRTVPKPRQSNPPSSKQPGMAQAKPAVKGLGFPGVVAKRGTNKAHKVSPAEHIDFWKMYRHSEQSLICNNFNSAEGCSWDPCNYLHICSADHGPHTPTQCRQWQASQRPSAPAAATPSGANSH